MRFTTGAIGALLFASATMAVPMSERRRLAHERRMARRSTLKIVQSTPPLSHNYFDMKDTVAVTASSGETDPNWAGAIQDSDGITQVSASVNFPEVSLPSGAPSTTEYLGSAWVGIDGDTCQQSILQTGIYWILEGTQTEFFAWYEWYPGPVEMFNISASQGDIFSLSVTAHNTTSGTAAITNESTGQSVSKTLTDQPALCLQNAEWIVEDNGVQPFAIFTPVTFTNTSWIANGTSNDLTGAILANIEQNNNTMTNCTIDSSTEVTCGYLS